MAAATPPPPPVHAKPKIRRHCAKARTPGYRFCTADRGRKRIQFAATVEVRHGQSWRILNRPLEGARGVWEWLDVWPSPDGRWLLLELGLECDTHRAFFLPAAGGEPRPATGEQDWRTSPNSLPKGWSADGRASVWVLGGTGDCGNSSPEPGRYLIDPGSGELDYVGKLPAAYYD